MDSTKAAKERPAANGRRCSLCDDTGRTSTVEGLTGICACDTCLGELLRGVVYAAQLAERGVEFLRGAKALEERIFKAFWAAVTGKAQALGAAMRQREGGA